MARLESENIRIKDIASIAGVSEGTVDRVLHNRGNVSSKSRERVERALKELNYSPNLYASALAHKRRSHVVVSLIPTSVGSCYWSSICDGIAEAHEELKSLNVDVRSIEFDQYKPQSFVVAANEALALNPQGVILAPIFTDESQQFIAKAKELGILVSTLDSYVECDDLFSYIGQDGELSGRLLAKILLMQSYGAGDILAFVSQREDSRFSTQFSLRYRGFVEYLSEHCRDDIKVRRVEIPFYDEAESVQNIKDIIGSYPETRAMVTFNSRSYVMGRALKEIQRRDITVVGYDAMPQNVEYLKEGYISSLIGTQPRLQGYRATKSICQGAILKQSVNRLTFVPLDMLFAENIDHYIQFDFK